MGLRISETEENGNKLLKVIGEVDLYSSPDLRQRITKAMPKNGGMLGVNLSEVPYMDSSGVATLVEGLRAASDKKAQLVLLAPSQPVMKVLQLSRLDTVFEIRDTL